MNIIKFGISALICLFTSYFITTAQTTSVELHVNMKQQARTGKFNPATETVDIAGSFNNWGGTLTPLSDNDKDSVYSTTISLPIGERIEFKFRLNSRWDGREELPGTGNNRVHTVAADDILYFWYNNEPLPNALDPMAVAETGFAAPNQPITIFDVSGGNPVSWQWRFPGGNPETSSVRSPSVRYSQAGIYPVTLTITNAEGESFTRTFPHFIRIGDTTLAWWNKTVFYEIFVRSFYDSDGNGNGDFRGLTQKLDYLNDGDSTTTSDLGITGIWLMPVQQSPTYHGYDATDYRTIEQDYGTNQDFKNFISEAHKRGIKVIVDFVPNHTSNQHPWFIESANPNSAKRNWYVWNATNPNTIGPWGQTVWHSRNNAFYYGLFWSGMPDLNYYTKEVRDEIFDITRFWLEEMDVDGFRLDAIKYLYEKGDSVENTEETITFWKDFRTHYKSINPEAFTVGEVWSPTPIIQRYMTGDGVDYCFEFELAGEILNAVNSSNTRTLSQKVQTVLQTYPYMQFGTFLTNHDIDRVMSTLNNNVNRAKMASALLLTLPGIPYLYYGEEIGMTGVKPDENIRTPLHWDSTAQAGFSTVRPWRAVNSDFRTKNIATQRQDSNSLWRHYQKYIKFRYQYPELMQGNCNIIAVNSPSIIAFTREYNGEVMLVVHNVATQSVENITVQMPIANNLLSDGKIFQNITNKQEALAFAGLSASGMPIFTLSRIQAQSTALYKLVSPTSVEDSKNGDISTLQISPIPAMEFITVSLPNTATGEFPYQIFDIQGREISSGVINHNRQNSLSIQLPKTITAGTYILVMQIQGQQLTKEFSVHK